MSSKRAKQHKERSHYGRLVREHINETNKGGAFDKHLNKIQCNPRKFRKRAYHHEKEIENESLKMEPLGLLRFVKAPCGPDPFEPFWATKEDKCEH